MKAMTWLKLGGGALVALAALAAADTRRIEISSDAAGDRHVIASRADACKVVSGAHGVKAGCCKKAGDEAAAQQGHSGCCRK